MKLTLYKPDTLGALASTLCMIHCFATPLLFIAQTCTVACESAPSWWRNLDYLFLVISFFAVYQSAKNTSRNLMKPALWISWIVLFLVIMNEKLNVFIISETITYISAFTLVTLHLYNLNYCKCKTDNCCTNHEQRTN